MRLDGNSQRFHELSTAFAQYTYAGPCVQQAGAVLAQGLHVGEGIGGIYAFHGRHHLSSTGSPYPEALLCFLDSP